MGERSVESLSGAGCLGIGVEAGSGFIDEC